MGKAGSFGGDALEDVVDERVHDVHGFAGDTSVRVNLLQHLIDVDSIAFFSLSPSLLLSISGGLCLTVFLLTSFPLLLCVPCLQIRKELNDRRMDRIRIKDLLHKDRSLICDAVILFCYFSWILSVKISDHFSAIT